MPGVPGGEVLPVHAEDHVGLCEVEQVGIAGDVARVVAEPVAAKVLLASQPPLQLEQPEEQLEQQESQHLR